MPRTYHRREIVDRWFDKISVNGDTGCWEFSGRTNYGYGVLLNSETRVPLGAHIVSYRHFIGDTQGLCVLHRCDNPKCSNPDHLFLGTRTDNSADKVAKGRQSKGEATGLTSLKESDISEIFRLKAAGESQRKIADRFGVGQSAVSRILNGKRWRHCAFL